MTLMYMSKSRFVGTVCALHLLNTTITLKQHILNPHQLFTILNLRFLFFQTLCFEQFGMLTCLCLMWATQDHFICCNTCNIPNELAKKRSIFYTVLLNPECLSFLWSFLDVSGDLDSQTIEVLASWMLEHPLTEEQQGGESPRQEGVPDTPSSDGPETVQCPERPSRQPSERLEIQREYLFFPLDISVLIRYIVLFSLLLGLDWIERENFLDVHLTRNRPPPARRRRSGPSQRTSNRRPGLTQSLQMNQNQ